MNGHAPCQFLEAGVLVPVGKAAASKAESQP